MPATIHNIEWQSIIWQHAKKTHCPPAAWTVDIRILREQVNILWSVWACSKKIRKKKHCWPGGCPFKWCFSVNITDCSKSVSRFIKMTTCIFGWPFYFKRNYIFSLFWLKIQMPNQLFCPNSAMLSLFLICFYFFKLSYPKVVSCLFLVKTQHSKSTFLFLKHSSVLISSPLLTCYLTRVNWSLLSQLSSTSVKSMFCRVSSRCAMYPFGVRKRCNVPAIKSSEGQYQIWTDDVVCHISNAKKCLEGWRFGSVAGQTQFFFFPFPRPKHLIFVFVVVQTC